MAIKIHHPPDGVLKLKTNAFVAMGIAGKKERVRAELLRKSDNHVFRGLVSQKILRSSRSQWCVYFKNLTLETGKNEYKLTVDGQVRNIKLEMDSSWGVQPNFPLAASSHCGDSFIAYGTYTAQDTTIVSAMMDSIDADSIFVDPENAFWSASFPHLDDGAYTLRIDGDFTTNVSVANLTIQASLC
jgi:hypothetical protein